MGVGGVRWCVVSLAASVSIAPASTRAEQVAPQSPPPQSPAAPGANGDATAIVGWTLPPDAARRYSPFFNGMLGGMSVGQRFDSDAYFGGELGAFFGPWRVGLRALFPFGVHQETGVTMSNPEFRSIASTKPALIGGVTLGMAVYSSTGFVSSIGLHFMRSDVSDFGNMLGVSLPLEWITRRGVRIGIEPGLMGAFGGEVLAECQPDDPFNPSPSARECDDGEIRAFDREADTGVWLHFIVGIPFDSPEPEPVAAPR